MLNLSRVSFDEVHKFGVLIVFQKSDFTETRVPKLAYLQFVAAKILFGSKVPSQSDGPD